MDLDRIVSEMHSLGDYLAKFSYPTVPVEVEDAVALLKSREIIVDGYPLIVHYSVSEDGTDRMETFQAIGQNMPFLPFNVVLKLAVRFLGDKHLCYVDEFVRNKRVYCFVISSDQFHRALPTQHEVVKTCEYEGVTFSYLDRNHVTFF